MSDLRTLRRGLEGEILTPDFDTLLAVAERRQRRRAVRVVAVVASAALAVGIATTARMGRPDATPPAHQSTQTLSAAQQRKVSELIGDPDAFATRVVAPDDPGTTAEAWSDCMTSYGGAGSCSTALRVTSGGRSSVYLIAAGGRSDTVLEYLRDGLFWFDDLGSIVQGTRVVVDASGSAPRPIRDGQMSPTISRPAPGWDVVACSNFVPCRVDLDAGVYAPLDIGGDGVHVQIDADHAITWSTSHDPLLWGVTNRGQGLPTDQPFTFEALWFTADGTGHVHTLATNHPGGVRVADGGPAGLLAFYVEAGGVDGAQPPTQLHTSEDLGETWRVRQVPETARDAVQQSTLGAGWETWPPA